MSDKLAILGGPKVRTKPFPAYNSIGEEEIDAVVNVMKSGCLSKYLGSWGEDFLGGTEVRSFEDEWSKFYSAKYTVAVNSNSSGIHIALGACGIGLGDEVIVSPYSMSVSASAPLIWNAIPVFADISPTNFGLDTQDIKKKITPKTKAIIVVHLFGCPADMDEINAIAKEHNLFVIEDCAQAPGSFYKGRPVGTLGDIGIFSLNYHKHIHTGEGGMCTTNDKLLAENMQLLRNHAESVVGPKGHETLINMIGFNMRLTELQAAIGRVQIKKIMPEVKNRQKIASMFNKAFAEFDFIQIFEYSDREHSYYFQPFVYLQEKTGVPRERVIDAIRAELSHVEKREDEGVPISGGYVRPIYLLPMFQKKVAYKDGFPFTGKENYDKGICPVVEDMHFNKIFSHDFTRSPLSEEDVNDVISAYRKVFKNIKSLS